MERKDPITTARKVQKADREKLRRDRLNEQFLELGNKLDPDRPKNDKATILTHTIQILKDLTSEVKRLKAESATLSEESREVTQEKNELGEEKTFLKSEIENLNLQYQQRVRVMFPWLLVESYPPYSYPVPVAVPPGSIPMQPFPFIGNQNSGQVANPCSTFVPFMTTTTHSNEQARTPYVATELQLKMPGSSASEQDLSSGGTNSSIQDHQDSSCNSVDNV